MLLYLFIKRNLLIGKKASFRQALKVLTRYDFIIYTHNELDLSLYNAEASALNKSFSVEFFDKDYFTSITGYNKLCLTVDFYKRVCNYEYLLIYQLDAWVFRDELEYWCYKGYDYVGAPFFKHFGCYEDGDKLWSVGNGGFSLRKISFMIRFLTSRYPINFHIDFKNGVVGFIKSCLKSIGVCNTVSYYAKHVYDHINEDHFFTNHISRITCWKSLKAKMPLPEEAASFAFERSPSYLYGICGETLPFGCHAFEKNEYETFWSKFIIK